MSVICDDQFSFDCSACYEVSRADDDLTFNYGLSATTQYYLWIVDNFKNSYRALITTDGSGAFTIDPTNAAYPTNLFNEYAGDFEVFLSNDVDGTDIVSFTLYATSYNCIILTITGSSNISCDPFTPAGCDPAYITDGGTIVEVDSGEAYTCTPCGDTNFTMIVNVDDSEQYNQIWNTNDTNIINIQ